MHFHLYFILVLAGLLRITTAGFIESYPLVNGDKSSRILRPFIIYVGIDVDQKLMKFFINSQVQDRSNLTTTDVLVSDVDPETNRYTTLNVKMDFMGKTFISENLRFCDYVAVKNTSRYGDSPRYDGQIPTSSSGSATASHLPENQNPFHIGMNNSLSRVKRDDTSLSHPWNPQNATGPSLDASTFDSISKFNISIDSFFSNSSGKLFQCPLYQNDSIALYYEADISSTFGSLGSYSFTFTVVSNDKKSDIIGGAVCYVTSTVESNSLKKLLFYGVAAICLCTFTVNFFIKVLSPDQESSNPFLIEASTICNARLLRQLDADPTKLLNYLQYAVFLGGLDVQYPGFFSSAISQIKWCILLDIKIIPWSNNSFSEKDNVFVTYHNNGLVSLISSNSDGYVAHSWPNFMLCLVIWISFIVVCYQIFITVKVLAKRKTCFFVGPTFGSQSASRYTAKSRPSFKNLLVQDSSSADSTYDQNDYADCSMDLSFKVHPAYESVGNNTASLFSFSLSINVWTILGQILRQWITTFGFPFLILTLHMLIRASEHDSMLYNYKQYFLALSAFNTTIPYQMLEPWKFLLPSHYPDEVTDNLPELRYRPSVKGPVAGGSIAIILWFTAVLYFVCYYFVPRSFRGNRRSNVYKLYSSVKSIAIWAHLYNVYKPSMLGFVLVDLTFTVVSSFVIVFLQSHGIAQVVLLSVIELLKYGLKLTFKPYYLASPWYRLDHVISSARVVVTILCIPYIRDLQVSEYARSCVAFTQLVIHLVVGLYYILYAIFCFALTAKAAFRAYKSKMISPQNEKSATGNDGLEEFEFRQVPPPLAQVSRETLEFTTTSQSSLNETEVDYYRAQSEKNLLNMESAGDADEQGDADADDEAFFQQAEKRIQKTDYTIREGDKIYRKYFLSNEMDPEMRELWERRNWNAGAKKNTQREAIQARKSWVESLKSRFFAKKPQGFEVVNRRPLVVQNRAGGGSESPKSRSDSLLSTIESAQSLDG